MALPYHPTRREFLKLGSACGAHLALMASPFPPARRFLWSRRKQGRVVAQETFGRLESVAEGIWAFIATPLAGDYTTVCNGGIVAGRSGVLVVEAFQTPRGAAWMAVKARELTGLWPTHVVLTHYHGDHTDGAEGYLMESAGSQASPVDDPRRAPRLHVTPTTRTLKEEGFGPDTTPELRSLWADLELISEEASGELDLGGRVVRVTPRVGHTPSDLTLDLPDEDLTFCGDLVWNGMFPNYMDTIPSRLSRAVRRLQARPRATYVPGHGPLASPEDLARYVSVLQGLEETARRAMRQGWTAREAAERHEIPDSLGEWTLFNPAYYQRAVEAWMREWGSEEAHMETAAPVSRDGRLLGPYAREVSST